MSDGDYRRVGKDITFAEQVLSLAVKRTPLTALRILSIQGCEGWYSRAG